MHKSFKHQFYKDCQLTFALFKDLTNAKELVQSVKNGEFQATLLKPQMVTGLFPVLVAANRAVANSRNNKLKTLTVHSEVLFCLSPDKNIFGCFRKFGLGDKDKAVLVVIIGDTDDKVLSDVRSRVSGTEIPVEDCASMTYTDYLKKTYKVTDQQLTACSLEDSIVTLIASKGLWNV